MLKRESQAVKAVARIYRAGSTDEARLAAAATELLKLGGIYVKFAQLLLLNKSFSKAVAPEVRRQIFDRVPVTKQQNYKDFFDAKDLAHLSAGVANIDEQPKFAGSFAAVFEAQSTDGQKLVVKVLRPELRRNLKRDLRLLGRIVRATGLFKGDVSRALRATYKGFRETTLRETNYKTEVINAQRLAEQYKDDPLLVIPKTYAEVSTDNYIVQQELEGVWVSELLAAELKADAASELVHQRTGSELPGQLYYLGYRSLYGSISGKPVHGDPHPGNIVLMEGNKVGLIDFGIIAEPIHNRLALLDYIKVQVRSHDGVTDLPQLMLAIVRFHASYLYQAIESLAAYYKRPLMDELYKYLQKEVDEHQSQAGNITVDEGNYSQMLSAAINKDNRFGLMPKLDQPLTQKAFVALWRTFDELGFMDITFRVFRDVVAAIERDFPTQTWKEAAMPIGQALEVVSEWLNMVAEKDPKLFRNLRALFKPGDAPQPTDSPSAS